MASFFDTKFDFLQASIMRQLTSMNQALGYKAVSDGPGVNSKPFSAVNRRSSVSPMIVGFIPPDGNIYGVSYASTARLPAADPIITGRRFNDPASGYLIAAIDNVRKFDNDAYDGIIQGAGQLGVSPEDYLAVILAKSGGDPNASPSSGLTQGLTQYTQADLNESKNPSLWSVPQSPGSAVTISTEVLKSQISRSGSTVNDATTLFQASVNVKTKPGETATLFADADPSKRRYDPAYTNVRPDGLRPLGKNDRGYNEALSSAQEAFDRNRLLNPRGKTEITTADIKGLIDRVKSTNAYQLGVQNIRARQQGQSVDPAESIENVTVGIMVDGVNIAENAPLAPNGRDGATEEEKRSLRNNQDVRRSMAIAIQRIRDTPPLGLLVNPSSFKRRYEHTVDYAKGRRSPIVSMWTEKPPTLDVSGQSAGQYVIGPDGNGGLTSGQRINSLSYENLMSLVFLYKNNGYVFYDGAATTTLNNVPFIPCSIYIYYDGRVYVGSFDAFSISDSAEKPFFLNFSFSFTVRAEYQVYNQ